MSTVLLIGAGATRAEANARRGNADQRPPLDTDFFKIAQRHGLEGHRDRVQAFVLDNYGIDLFRYPRPGMEEVFGLVYTSTVAAPVPPKAKDAFSSLCRIYATVIARTTNWLSPTMHGPLCRLIRQAARGHTTTIITFNHDILIERALWRLSQTGDPVQWYPDTGYKMDFALFSAPTASRQTGTLLDLAPNGAESSPIVLKPHGSLNWYAKTLKKDTVLSTLRKGQKIHCTRRVAVSADMTVTQHTASGKGRKTWYTWPIIVPPIVEKGTFLGTAVEGVWNVAWDAIVQADRIIVYGYSFPVADVQTRAFFLRASSTRAHRPLLVTINPDVGAADRAHAIFSPELHLVADSVRTYLRRANEMGLGG